MTAVLNKKGVLIYEDELIKHLASYSDKTGDEKIKYGLGIYVRMKRQFTKTVKLKFNKLKSAKLVHIEKINNRNVLVIPRFLAFMYLTKGYIKEIKNNISYGNIIEIDEVNFEPTELQQICHDKIIDEYFNEDSISAGSAGVICELEAGKGKTFLAATIVNTFKFKTLYVVPNNYLLEQGIEDFRKCFPKMKIGQYHATKKTDGDVVFIIINSILSKEFTVNGEKWSPKKYFAQFGLSIFDEVHEYASMKRVKAFSIVNTLLMLGITAEANNREDKMDFLSHYNCGPVFKTNDLINEGENIQYKSKVRIIKYNGPEQYTRHLINDSTGWMQMSLMVRQIIKDPYRMNLIISYAIKLYKENRNFFIWCDMRDVVLMIKEILEKIGLPVESPEENNIAHLMGGTKKIDIIKAQNSRIIVATYQYAYRGISLPKFDAMIFATPRRAKTYQTLKRIFRLGGDESIERLIIDIVDNNTKLKAQLTDRRKQYNRPLFNMTIIEEKVNYNNVELDNNIVDIHNNIIDKRTQN